MIAETVFVMTILGCGNSTHACDFVAEPKVTYETKVSCEAAVGETMLRYQDAAYPVLVGDCMPKPNTVQTAQVKAISSNSQQGTLQLKPAKPNRFEELRANANSDEFDLLVQAKAMVIRATDTTKEGLSTLRDSIFGN